MRDLLVKICGLSTVRDIEVAVESGADAIGLVLSPSPRRVAGRMAVTLFDAIPPGVERIAVLGPEPGEERGLLSALPWDGVQAPVRAAMETPVPLGSFFLPCVHAERDAETLGLSGGTKRRRGFGNRNRMGAVLRAPGWVGAWDGCGPHRGDLRSPRPDEGTGPKKSSRGPQPGTRARTLRGAVLLDGAGGGGRGTPVDPERAGRLCRRGEAAGIRVVLAGGLTPETVGAAIVSIRPAGVDVSSGVEFARGRKDPARIRAFLAAVRAHQSLFSDPSASAS